MGALEIRCRGPILEHPMLKSAHVIAGLILPTAFIAGSVDTDEVGVVDSVDSRRRRLGPR